MKKKKKVKRKRENLVDQETFMLSKPKVACKTKTQY